MLVCASPSVSTIDSAVARWHEDELTSGSDHLIQNEERSSRDTNLPRLIVFIFLHANRGLGVGILWRHSLVRDSSLGVVLSVVAAIHPAVAYSPV